MKNRLVSLSDVSLAVIDYTDHEAPVVTEELTLARNVDHRAAAGSDIAEISSDWWGNDQTWSEVRLLPIGDAEETADAGDVPSVRVDGVNARVFTNGKLAYVVTNVQVPATCDTYGRPVPAGATGGGDDDVMHGARGTDPGRRLDHGVTLRGKVRLPADAWGWWGWGWGGVAYRSIGSVEPRSCRSAAMPSRSAAGSRLYDPTNGNQLDANSSLWVVDLVRTRMRRRRARLASPTIRTAGGGTCSSPATPFTPATTTGSIAPWGRQHAELDGPLLRRPGRL